MWITVIVNGTQRFADREPYGCVLARRDVEAADIAEATEYALRMCLEQNVDLSTATDIVWRVAVTRDIITDYERLRQQMHYPLEHA